ncbi:MAG: hypothetical protein J6B60_02520 [Clostridia bacterium]|nr:hypothetical protein [Clostridia bacterium]
MKKYQTPEYELCLVDTTDIINTSTSLEVDTENGGNLDVGNGEIFWP